jgi:mRNA interferase RelE/StbE
MPTYKTRLSRSAEKEFDRLDSTLQTRILKKLKGLEANPRGLGAIKLAGDEAWRVRVGDYRIIFDIHDDILLVLVVKIGHRREVYR